MGLADWPAAPALAADVYARGGTLAQHWHQLQQRYGAFEYRSGYFIAQPPSKSAAVFERLRAAPPTTIGGLRVAAVRDLGTGVDTAQPGGRISPAGLRCGAPFVRPLRTLARPCGQHVCVNGCLPVPRSAAFAEPWPAACLPADGKAVLPWSPGDLMVTYTLQDGAWFTLRVGGPPCMAAAGGATVYAACGGSLMLIAAVTDQPS